LKIYTRKGDRGETSLYGGSRVRKDSLRVEAYGSVDELNAVIGAALATLGADSGDLGDLLSSIQSELFDVGAELAMPPERAGTELGRRLRTVGSGQVAALERAIDLFDGKLPPLKSFILPSGTVAAAMLHVARTVARRAEREVVALSAAELVNPELLRYLNRLSDLLFVLARTANYLAKVEEQLWKG
jgi:cob(I)alamin adenosyltransferase